MKDLDARIADRRAREKSRIESGDARDTDLANHAGEALNPETNAPEGDGTRKEGAQGASGAWSPPGKAGKALPTPPAPPVVTPPTSGTDPTA